MSKRESIDELLAARPEPSPPPGLPAVVVGELVALVDEGQTPLVLFPGQPCGMAMRARTAVDLHGVHIGQQVMLVFEAGDAAQPIVTGVLQPVQGWPLAQAPGEVQIEQDGRRMVVGAREQLVLRCGKASITLTKAGKILIRGAYVASVSSGVNRIKGGSVQLN
ncbi:DUF6484 domain-containing protein [Variovorax paradoxus]|uniref:DUF6484 domain-containing protein n=1 Tax=Variovorax paradoxus TaxID=34073 RepID=UPI00278B690C|nr:DUF6484 domain-containing protein [Variovorax paradoxus]MDQ0588986.1 hypothetical protein [Variovorax paradoxus]